MLESCETLRYIFEATDFVCSLISSITSDSGDTWSSSPSVLVFIIELGVDLDSTGDQGHQVDVSGEGGET